VSATIREFFQMFPDDETCLRHLFEVRFGQDHACPGCKRTAKWYRIKKEPAYSCQWCGHHIHPMAGTLFEDTRTPLQDWFYAIYLFTTLRHGVPAKELQRQLGVTYKTAWRMGHEIRKHMMAVDGDPPLSGEVEADETYIGGVNKGAGRGRGLDNKAILFGMVERDGDVMTKVIHEADSATLAGEIGRSVTPDSTIHTDEYKGYRGVEKRGYVHKTVNHSEGVYATEDGRGMQTIDGFFSRLKNSIRGTHVHVSKKHLSKYAGEFEYRYNSRKQPGRMLDELLSVFPQPDKE
jgi:transposase-like protein